ncbi:MAG: prolyl oligopeptidase family serine peptidase [Lentisphaeria bacterium]|nr:prolyl oligopeptidase family serine peptidase [Lentisphaeria bacterium]
MLHFHGAGSRGRDNERQLGQALRFAGREWQEGHPFFILAPQLPPEKRWVDIDIPGNSSHIRPDDPTPHLRSALELLESLMQSQPVDPARIYVNGQSLGGAATWDIITRRPDLFAAAVPLCGGGDVRLMPEIAHLPVWAFHGAKDKAVSVENSRRLVRALQEAGGRVRYTEFPDVEHNAWDFAYEHPGLREWLFSQARAATGQ